MATNIILLHPRQAWLLDGTEIRLCPLELTEDKILYCSRDARFFSHRWLRNPVTGIYEWTFNEIQPDYRPNAPSRNSGGWANYKIMRQCGSEYCHTLVLSTWDKPRPSPDHECDHLDGDTLNNHLDNLEWVTSVENRHRRWTAFVLCDKHIDPLEHGIPGLKKWFAIFHALRMDRSFKQIGLSFSRDDLLSLFSSFRHDPTFDQMEYEMTHHMEI